MYNELLNYIQKIIGNDFEPSLYYNEFLGNGMFNMDWDLERFRTEKCRTCKFRIVEDNISYCEITTDNRNKNGLHRVKARRETCFTWKQK